MHRQNETSSGVCEQIEQHSASYAGLLFARWLILWCAQLVEKDATSNAGVRFPLMVVLQSRTN